MRDSDVSRITGQFRDAADDAGRVAAERQAARTAEFVTDPATLEHVAAALRKDMPAVDVLSRHTHLGLPADTLERRTYTPLLRGAR
jgi:hypothetical protein